MHKPFDSIVALARFEFTAEQRAHAENLLQSTRAWPVWMNQVELHGLSGWVSKHVAEQDFSMPAEQKLALKALNLRHNAATEARYQAMRELSDAFTAAGIRWVALKGVALMPLIYQEGRLRPMRDIDVLLPAEQLGAAEAVIRELGYSMPLAQPSKFMRDMHQLPNATKTFNGFTVSLELHHDGISREVPGHFYYPESEADIQHVQWRDLSIPVLANGPFLHQVAKHLEGLHNEAVLKLINVMDVIGLAQYLHEQGELTAAIERYPHLRNTLRCLHLYTPLPESLAAYCVPLPSKTFESVGVIMVSLRTVFYGDQSLRKRAQLLLRPSDWWMHLYYNVDPQRSLLIVKWLRHPLRLLNWVMRRMYSRLRGG